MPFKTSSALISILLVLVSFMQGSYVSANSNLCDKGIYPVPGKAGYMLRGDRCEGLYKMPVGAKSI